ncbi:MAG TPA: FAD-dependent oxidoreductase [Solirubrobacteraceae bacterium]|nr:FAD-dependent oxidoreductase [Solirubrobacteraceae bacterium]
MSTHIADGIVIAGGGLAGQRCAETLRRSGYEQPIRMLCAEVHRPYDRPPLSKEMLTGEHPADELPFRAPEWYEQHDIDLLLGVSATGLAPAERRVFLSDGSSVRYDKLLIATGSRPRMLPLLESYDNVSVLRTVDDSVRLAQQLAARPALAVIGAGFIGQEVAATARSLGAEVVMIEAAPSPLHAILGAAMGDWFTEFHRARGVDVVGNATVTGVSANGAVRAVRLSNERVLPVDHVVVGIGVVADVDWLSGSGLQHERGIPVDPHGRTEIDDVFAAGDAAATFDPMVGSHVPGSHWEAAGRQGARAARAMLGLEPGSVPRTSFWTDQYGIRIQYLGHARLADSVTIDSEPGELGFTATFTRAGRAVAALLVDRPRALPAARKLIENGEQG